MSAALPDVNVLIALIDPTHVHHDRAHAWFAGADSNEWVTVPITENGVLRIVSHPSYPNVQPLPVVMNSLQSLVSSVGHRFEPDAISLLDSAAGPMLSSSQVTDTYLIALARELGARLITFDRRIVTTTVADAPSVVDIIN